MQALVAASFFFFFFFFLSVPCRGCLTQRVVGLLALLVPGQLREREGPARQRDGSPTSKSARRQHVKASVAAGGKPFAALNCSVADLLFSRRAALTSQSIHVHNFRGLLLLVAPPVTRLGGGIAGLLEAPFETLEAQIEGMWRELLPDLAVFPMPTVRLPASHSLFRPHCSA